MRSQDMFMQAYYLVLAAATQPVAAVAQQQPAAAAGASDLASPHWHEAIAGRNNYVRLGPAPQLELGCGGCTPENPLQGAMATATVTFAGRGAVTSPAWVRLDRCDDHDDNSIWTEYFPRVVPAGATFDFSWLQGSTSTSITVTASGWSARYNGTRLTANSTNATVFFSFAYRSSISLLEVESPIAGTAALLRSLLCGCFSRRGERGSG